MKAFIDRVNARLPVDEPDLILLALVQGYQEKVCGSSCPAGQGLADDGRCLPNSIITNLAKKSVTLASSANPPLQRLARTDNNDVVNTARPGVSAPIEDSMVTPAPITEQCPPLQDDRARLAAVAPAPKSRPHRPSPKNIRHRLKFSARRCLVSESTSIALGPDSHRDRRISCVPFSEAFSAHWRSGASGNKLMIKAQG
jgi:hypothetical protein